MAASRRLKDGRPVLHLPESAKPGSTPPTLSGTPSCPQPRPPTRSMQGAHPHVRRIARRDLPRPEFGSRAPIVSESGDGLPLPQWTRCWDGTIRSRNRSGSRPHVDRHQALVSLRHADHGTGRRVLPHRRSLLTLPHQRLQIVTASSAAERQTAVSVGTVHSSSGSDMGAAGDSWVFGPATSGGGNGPSLPRRKNTLSRGAWSPGSMGAKKNRKPTR